MRDVPRLGYVLLFTFFWSFLLTKNIFDLTLTGHIKVIGSIRLYVFLVLFFICLSCLPFCTQGKGFKKGKIR